MSKKIEIAYIESKGKYFVVTSENTSFSLESKDRFDRYVKENNCKIINSKS